MFEDSFLLQFQQLCGSMADLAVTRLLGYSCLLLVGVLQAQSSKIGLTSAISMNAKMIFLASV